jgi:phage tail-like protein
VRLRGTGRATPRLQSLRIYYPRFSYLAEYLPAVFRDDETSASFLDRYLANVEGTFTALEGRIEQAQALFDTRTVPAEYLDWLGDWLGATLDFTWGERTKRRFLANAPRIMRERGTRAGLLRALRLALEADPDESVFGDGAAPPFTVRVVERFLTRRAPGVVFGDPTDIPGPGSTTESLDWTPAMGAEPLHRRYRDFLRGRYGDAAALNAAWGSTFADFDDARLVLAATRPPRAAEADDWQRFVRERLGFTYAVAGDADAPLYRDFLARRYRQVGALARAYGLVGAAAPVSFATLPLPAILPHGGRPLDDWITFVSLVLPTERNAHRFTVLVPITLGDTPDAQRAKLELARRITELEKPAHTAFDVRLYWAMFRVGEARVGYDSVVGQGSRFTALVLGRNALGASYLGTEQTGNTHDRAVVGDERLGRRAFARRPNSRYP